jgi:hypothetical protein
LEVLRSGARLPLGGRQQRAILALLLCAAGKVVSQGRLADGLSALEATDPGDALRAWTQIDRAIAKSAAIVPAVNQIDWWFVSTRVHNFQSKQILGQLLSQIWVK